jgi:hypothetical protein
MPPVQRGSRSFGKETRDALVGQPGRSARRRGNPKPNPLFRSPAEPEPSGKGTAKGRPESLLEGRPEGTRRVRPERNGRSGSRVRPVGKEPKGQSPACRKDVHGNVTGLPEGRPRESRRLAGWTPTGWSPACRKDVHRMVAGSPERRPTDGSGACLVKV